MFGLAFACRFSCGGFIMHARAGAGTPIVCVACAAFHWGYVAFVVSVSLCDLLRMG